MHLEIKIASNGVSALPPPVRQLLLPVVVKVPDHMTDVKEGEAVEVLGAAVKGRLISALVWAGDWQASHGYIPTKGETYLQIPLPMDRERLDFIERHRNGTITFALEVALRFRVLSREQPEIYLSPLKPARSEVTTASMPWTVDRDQWVELLEQLGWDEIEIFELTTGTAFEVPEMAEALEELRHAQNELRRKDYANRVLVHCSAALEAVAKYKGNNNTKVGFDTMVAEAFPNEPKKAAAVNAMIQQIRDFTQLARHKEYPIPRITWAEARFILTTTLSVFEVLTNNPASWEDPTAKR